MRARAENPRPHMALANPEAQHQTPIVDSVPTMRFQCWHHGWGTCPLLYPLTPFMPCASPFPSLQLRVPKSFGFSAFLMPELFLTTKLPALRRFPPAANNTGHIGEHAVLRYLPRRQLASMGPQQSRMAQRPVRATSTLPHIVFEARGAMASQLVPCPGRCALPCRAMP